MRYFKEMYGPMGNDFIKGVLAAIDAYAVYEDGTRWIGSPEKEAKVEMLIAIKDLGGNIEDFLDYL